MHYTNLEFERKVFIMRVFIAGATGRVGKALTKDLVANGHQVVAGVHNTGNVEKDPAVSSVKLDLTAPVNDIAKLLDDMDAVYFTAGSRGKNLLQIDAFGAVKLMEATQQAGIKRFVLLSSIFADKPEKWGDPYLKDITDYNIAKFFADKWLINGNIDLNYTIVQPGNLLEKPATGKVQFNMDHSEPNSLNDVALVLANVLDKPNTYKKVIRMSNGDTPIDDAIANV